MDYLSKKVLIIGNSHAVCFIDSLKKIDWDINIVIVSEGHGGASMLYCDKKTGHLNIKNNASPFAKELFKKSLKGNIFLDLLEYEIILFIGFHPPPKIWDFCSIGTFNHKRDIKREQPVSFDFFSKWFEEQASQKLKIQCNLVSIILSLSPDTLVATIPYPYVAYLPNQSEKQKINKKWLSLDVEQKLECAKIVDYFYSRYFLERGMYFFEMPEIVKCYGQMCKTEYSLGGLGTKNFMDKSAAPMYGNLENPSNQDLTHKNEMYGSVYVESIITKLKTFD